MDIDPRLATAMRNRHIPLSVQTKHADPNDPDFARFMEGADWLQARWQPTVDRLHSQRSQILDLLATLPRRPAHGGSKSPEAAALTTIRLILEETP